MRKRLLPLFTFLLLAALPESKAQILGGEIDYNVLNDEKIEVDVTLYTNANVVLPSRFYFTVTSEESSNYQTHWLTSSESKNISSKCESACKNSNDPNCGSENEIVAHKINTTLLLTEQFSNTDCNIVLSLRSYTYIDGKTENITLSSTFNRCSIDKNSSPEFNYAPTYLIPGNQIYSFDHSAKDSDGDSLYYSLVPSITYNGISRNYDNGLSHSSPFYYLGYPRTSGSFPMGFNFNNSSGILSFVPTKYQTEQLAVRVEEFRNGQKIGEKTRDVSHKIYDAENKTPYITGINGGLKTAHTACVGTEECFSIEITDKNHDNLNTHYTHNLTGAKFSLSEKNGNQELSVCFTPKPSDLGKTFFIKIHTQDDGCVYNLSYNQLITISVTNSFTVQPITSIVGCGEVSFNAKTTGKNNDYDFTWTVDNELANKAQKFNQIFNEHGNHSLNLVVIDQKTGCRVQKSKSFNIPSKPEANAGDDLKVCANDEFTLNAQGGDKVKWLNIENPSEVHNRSIITQLEETKTFELQVIDKYGCKDYDEVVVLVDKVEFEALAIEPVI
ncbi:MAG: hypothetical protein KDC92_14815, partial [Bacteroidetes bacterium]|nr:hypothetical protein [Bacteroidota bacterium]